MTISNLNVGQNATVDLLVKEAQTKMTRTNKEYLLLKLSDGKQDIQAHDWDWEGKSQALPIVGSVITVSGAVSEYNGNKQIKVSKFTSSHIGVEEFAPQGKFEYEEVRQQASELIDCIQSTQLHNLVKQVFNDNVKGWETIPAATGIHHAYVSGLLHHTVNVTLKAKALAELTPECNVDLVVAGALLHDMGKLWTYKLNGAIIEMTDEGQMLEHLVLGIREIERYRNADNTKVMDLIQHIISSHHGLREYGSPTTPLFIEAVIVNFADGVDAKTQTIIEANETARGKQTDKIWIMENRKMYTQKYINDIVQE